MSNSNQGLLAPHQIHYFPLDAGLLISSVIIKIAEVCWERPRTYLLIAVH